MKIFKQRFKGFQSVFAIFIVVIIISSGTISAVNGLGNTREKDNLIETDEELNPSPPGAQIVGQQMSKSNEEGIFLDIVDSSKEVGKYSSIAEKDEHIYMTYYDEESADLKIASKDIRESEEGWMRWNLGEKVDGGRYSSLDISDESLAHIAYYDSENTRLNYTTWCIESNQVKETEVIDDVGDVGQYTSLELDDDNDPKISYFDRSDGALKYAERGDSGGWETQTVDDYGSKIGKYTSLALDSLSNPHISYYDWGNRDLKYAFWNEAEEDWSTKTIEIDGMHAGKYTSIELDGDDYVHISSHGWTDDDDHLVYATNSFGGGWTHDIIFESEPTGTYTSLELSENKEPLISYHEWGKENLKFASRYDGEWRTAEIDTNSRVGSFTSLHYAGNAEVHIAYHDHGKGDLKHARYFFKNRTPLAPQSFQTRSEYGDIILEWDTPIYDGIKAEGEHILGYHVYRRSGEGGDFNKIANVTGLSYTDEIAVEDEEDIYEYKVAAVNKKGVGDNTSIIDTKGRYFSYERTSESANRYKVEGLLPFSEDENTESYEVRWDLDYNSGEEPTWEEDNFEEGMVKDYDDVGLKTVLLEYENGNGDKRRCLQSAWVLGEFDLTSTYEKNGSEENFFYLPDGGIYEHIGSEDSLRNTYVLETPKDMPYEYVEFEFLEDNYSVNEADQVQNKDVWRKTINVSDSKEDTEVKVTPYLDNELREEVENPLSSPHQIELDNKMQVEIIETPGWFAPLLDEFFGEHLQINNKKENGDYTGWEVAFEIPETDDNDENLTDKLEKIDISGAPKLDILDDLQKFFGGDYGFEMELFPDRDITFDNNLDFETTLIRFQTDVKDDDIGLDDFEGELGNSYSYAAETDMKVSASVSIDLLVKRGGISVSGNLGLDFNAGIKIDIPLQSIGLAEVGLTAEVGGEIGVEYEIGSLDYEVDKGLSPDPGGGEVPIEFILSFGGGPYGEVGAGLARVEGKLILDAIMDLKIPSLDYGLNHEGRFEVEVSAGWGLWSKTKKWELYSTRDSSSMAITDTNGTVQNQMFTTDRLATTDYKLGEETTMLDSNGFGQKRNVGPEASPQIVSLDGENAIAVWSELSKDAEGDVQSDLFYQEFSNGSWKAGSKQIITEGDMAYDPELVKVNNEIGLIYKEIEKRPDQFDTVEELESYYTNDTLRGKSWDGTGWSDLGLNHSNEDQAITNFDVDVNDQGKIHIVYRSGRPSLDMFDSPSSEEGNISVLKQEGGDWNESLKREEYMPQSSRPSIEFVNGEAAIIYTRTVDADGDYNQTVLVPLDSEEEKHLIETSNTTSHQLLSEENGVMVVTWVENHTEIRRKLVKDIGGSWNISDGYSTVHSNETVAGLSHHVNETSSYYIFQKGKNVVPTVLESSDDGWSKERSVLDNNIYAPDQLDPCFGLEDPTILLVEEDDRIESWHRVHHRFDGSLSDGRVLDRSDKGNTGALKGNWTKNLHDNLTDHDRGGNYVTFDGKDSKMMVNHSSSLNVTEENEDFTVTTLLKEDDYDDQGYLMRKEGSWDVALNGGELEVELWDENEKHTIPTEMSLSTNWTFFALRYEKDWLNVTLKSYGETGSLVDHTENISLNDFGSLSSSTEPLVVAESSGVLSLDDFRLVERYLPTASIEKINRTSYPSFDVEYSVTTEKVPPYVNFTHTETPIVGENTSFKGQSPRAGLNYSWSFEDGGEKYGQEIEHRFDETGYHTVTLEAEDNETGAKTRCERTLHVIDANPPEFSADPLIKKYENNKSVRLEWKEAEGETEPFEYRIHHETGEVVEFDHLYWEKSTSNNFTVLEDLDPTVQHNIKVSVRNDVGLTNLSSEPISFQIEDDLPPKFEGLDSTYVDQTERKVGLVWDEAEDPSQPISYNIYHSKDGNLTFKEPIKITDKTATEIALEFDLSEIREHHFAVRAEDDEGNEDDNMKIESIKVKDVVSPEVEILTPSEEETVGSTVTVEWDAYDNDSGVSTNWVKSDHHDSWVKLDGDNSNYTFEELPEGKRTLEVFTEDMYGNRARDKVNLTVIPQATIPEIISRTPSNGLEKVDTDPELQVQVGIATDDEVMVSFYDASGDSLIGTVEDLKNDENGSIQWTGLEHGTTYEWYVVLEQGENTVRSETWQFQTLDMYSLEVNVEGNGSTDPPQGKHTFEEGKSVELEASPDDGWQFSSWSGDHNADERNVKVEMNGNKQVTAHFEKIEEKIEYELRVNITGEGSIGIDDGTHTFEKGENISLQAMPDEGWYFENWTGDLQDDDEWLNFTIEDDMDLTANFDEKEEQSDGNTDDGESGTEDDEGVGYAVMGSLTLLDKILLLILVGLVVSVTIHHVREKD